MLQPETANRRNKMVTRNHMRTLGLILSFFLLVGISLQPLSVSAEEELNGPVEDTTPCSFLRQDEIGVDRPFQVQIMVSTGGSTRNRSVNPAAAIHLGYRFSDLMYLGWTSQTFYNDNTVLQNDEDKRYDDEDVYGQEGARKTTVRTDPRHLLEMRFFPWRFGLYFSAGIMHYGHEKTTTEFKSRPRIINETEYNTGLTTTLEYKEWTGAATGAGFNHTFDNGFTLSSGINVGLTIQKPEITIESDVAIAATDLDEWKDQIETNEQRIPVMFHLGVGYAF